MKKKLMGAKLFLGVPLSQIIKYFTEQKLDISCLEFIILGIRCITRVFNAFCIPQAHPVSNTPNLFLEHVHELFWYLLSRALADK